MDEKKQFKAINDHIQDSIKKRAYETQASRIAVITAVKAGKRYDIKTSDGDRTFQDVPNTVPDWDWRVGQWVTFEFTGTGYAIIGSSPSGAGAGI